MEFFGLTLYGPQNYIQDTMRKDYVEPQTLEDVKPIMNKIVEQSYCPDKLVRPDAEVIRLIDCYIGRVNGFAYGSFERFVKMKKKGVIKPAGPADRYRIPPTTSTEIGWWQCDADLINKKWYLTYPRRPQPASPNTLILDKARKNNKYATLF